jgi:hypothetical protein
MPDLGGVAASLSAAAVDRCWASAGVAAVSSASIHAPSTKLLLLPCIVLSWLGTWIVGEFGNPVMGATERSQAAIATYMLCHA